MTMRPDTRWTKSRRPLRAPRRAAGIPPAFRGGSAGGQQRPSQDRLGGQELLRHGKRPLWRPPVRDGRLLGVNVGDSRLYLLRAPGRIKQVTQDHSLVEEMIQAGRIDREITRTLPDKNIITRAVGAEDYRASDFFRKTLTDGEVLLLCLDGLTNMVTDEERSPESFFPFRSPQEAADRLILPSAKHGGRQGQYFSQYSSILLIQAAGRSDRNLEEKAKNLAEEPV